MKYLTKTVEETIRLGEQYAKNLKGGDVVLLDGDLGAGKTHFAKGVAIGLGITELVTSPTFTLHNIYEGGRLPLNHFDFYRLTDEEEAEILGLTEYFYDKSSVCLLEWWQNVKGLLPSIVKKVFIKVVGDNEREIIIDE